MKKMMGTTAILLFTLALAALPAKKVLKGIVTDAQTNAPIAGALVVLGNQQTLSNENGMFHFTQPPGGNFTISSLGYRSRTYPLPANLTETGTYTLTPVSLFLQPLEVRSIRASDKAPFTKTNIGKEAIAKQNLGQDIPFLLNQTPSVVVNSDAGNGVGYTGIRIRGTDATRVNVTLNGIPYNDAESMGTFFVNLPDFSSSVNSIQVQRGVGTSSNGAGAFGATLNMSTHEYNEKAYVALNNSYGSFNTWKNTLKAGTGLIGKHFLVDARLSNISSDGYIDRASSRLRSFYLGTAYINQKTALRFNVFSGHEKTYQAWYGIDAATLATNRKFNPAGMEKSDAPYNNQTDNYTQTHYQLFLNQALGSGWSFNTALFLTRGKGYYEEYKADQAYSKYGLPDLVTSGTTYTSTNLVRQRWLDNYFYGQIASLHYKSNRNEFTIGGGWTQYDGKHIGKITWMERGTVPDNYQYYHLPANKKDLNVYAKWQHRLTTNLTGFADLQYRHVSHTMNGFSNNPGLFISRKFDFVNPKAGLSYQKNGWQAYLSLAIGRKEPNREDFEAGLLAQPAHETLKDWELGIEKKESRYSYGVTFYHMDYRNQLVLTGKINDVGAYTRTNIPSSYRMGVELQGAAVISPRIQVSGNLTLSKNKIKNFTEYIDNYDDGTQITRQYNNTDISFSANTIGTAGIHIIPVQHAEISLLGKYVSKQYLDNTQNENRKLNGYFTQDIRAIYTLQKKTSREIQFIFQVYNLFNKKYEPNGYTFSHVYSGTLSTENYYYPMAGRHFMFAVNIKI
ncbi:MAG: TonB-dependent receptor plug domain-containing protein [Sediminibacterium sp.]|nr:TonB-dependent receptor plug domain-containing protein [Sediminibacterium sp.]